MDNRWVITSPRTCLQNDAQSRVKARAAAQRRLSRLAHDLLDVPRKLPLVRAAHQLEELASTQVDQFPMIARLEIDVFLLCQIFSEDRLDAVGLSYRRDGTKLAVFEQVGKIKFLGQPKIPVELFA